MTDQWLVGKRVEFTVDRDAVASGPHKVVGKVTIVTADRYGRQLARVHGESHRFTRWVRVTDLTVLSDRELTT